MMPPKILFLLLYLLKIVMGYLTSLVFHAEGKLLQLNSVIIEEIPLALVQPVFSSLGFPASPAGWWEAGREAGCCRDWSVVEV